MRELHAFLLGFFTCFGPPDFQPSTSVARLFERQLLVRILCSPAIHLFPCRLLLLLLSTRCVATATAHSSWSCRVRLTDLAVGHPKANTTDSTHFYLANRSLGGRPAPDCAVDRNGWPELVAPWPSINPVVRPYLAIRFPVSVLLD
ncbi:hypothetical protein B0I35DRAFT_111036 [Stachybotrys elegans]|uniref:Uncharacterized protein n=1 Tax=Stachybotrys elegans TaxID=80388 RepID=A0A8K0SEM9_9HYPO|nr:hypothetical protein B0I35DRAFT_111036 [Stachybotrys elegans]